jgi:hypothetical protein
MTGSGDRDVADLAALLLPHSGGREAAIKMLAWVREQSEARCVSLWSASSELRLLLSASLDQEAITSAERTWREQQEMLDDGRPVQDGSQVIVSVDVDGGSYLMALEGVTAPRLSVETLTRYARVAARAIRNEPTTTVDGPGLRREDLVARLERERWALTPAGRRKETATLYKKMTRLGLSRGQARP